MQTKLATQFRNTGEGQEAEAILRKCVHCGFCSATCPTYQLLGDELDGPRGRIYLIKQVLEGKSASRSTQVHLDRCLTCRNCETTCPSGVQYGRLVEIGRHIVDEQVARPIAEKAVRWMLKEGLNSPLFGPAMQLGRAVRPVLPDALRAKVPMAVSGRAGQQPRREHPRRVLMLEGCVQPAMLPNINNATARVLDAARMQVVVAQGAGCCGAIRSHLSDPEGGLADMRRNIDAWWPLISNGAVEAIITSASACSLAIKEYGRALAHDVQYAKKAAAVSSLARDLSELLPELVPALKEKIRPAAGRRLAFHPPCTLQHGQKLGGLVELHLRALGFDVNLPRTESHLCCGSAGTYSVLQPEIATQLRDRKLSHLQALEAHCIVSANVGCITHLQSGTNTPVRHWVELLDEALQPE